MKKYLNKGAPVYLTSHSSPQNAKQYTKLAKQYTMKPLEENKRNTRKDKLKNKKKHPYKKGGHNRIKIN